MNELDKKEKWVKKLMTFVKCLVDGLAKMRFSFNLPPHCIVHSILRLFISAHVSTSDFRYFGTALQILCAWLAAKSKWKSLMSSDSPCLYRHFSFFLSLFRLLTVFCFGIFYLCFVAPNDLPHSPPHLSNYCLSFFGIFIDFLLSRNSFVKVYVRMFPHDFCSWLVGNVNLTQRQKNIECNWILLSFLMLRGNILWGKTSTFSSFVRWNCQRQQCLCG